MFAEQFGTGASGAGGTGLFVNPGTKTPLVMIKSKPAHTFRSFEGTYKVCVGLSTWGHVFAEVAHSK